MTGLPASIACPGNLRMELRKHAGHDDFDFGIGHDVFPERWTAAGLGSDRPRDRV